MRNTLGWNELKKELFGGTALIIWIVGIAGLLWYSTYNAGPKRVSSSVSQDYWSCPDPHLYRLTDDVCVDKEFINRYR